MPNDVIDTLSLEITSNAQSADKALNGLVKSLQNLQGAVDGVSNINFGNFTSAMASLKKAFSGFSGSDNLSKGISQIQRYPDS